MNEAERIAYHTGLYNLPGNVPGRMWSTVGERLWWERGNRERLASEQSAADATSGSRAPGGGFDVGQLKDGVGALIGGAGAVAAFFITLGFLDQDAWSGPSDVTDLGLGRGHGLHCGAAVDPSPFLAV